MEQFLADLLRMMGSGMGAASAKVDMARAMAQGVASGSMPEPNVDPAQRMAIEALVPVAELHVAELTGLPVDHGRLQVQAVPPGTWAWQTVDDWAFILDAAASATPPPSQVPAAQPDEENPGAGITEFLAQAMSTMGPVLAAMQLGSAVGHLARSTMGTYELPVPRPDGQRLLLVPANLDRFAEDWSLPVADVRLWVCLRDVTMRAVLGREPVADRFRHLLGAVARTTAHDNAAALHNLEDLDLANPEALQQLMGEPEALLGVEPSPARQRAADELAAASLALVGYVEHVLDQAADRLLGGRGALGEAWRRWQVARDGTDRAAEGLLGLDLEPGQVDRGTAFVQGVVARAGDDALSRLWAGASGLPTPAELDAPGLWLERTSYPDPDPEPGADGASGGGGADGPHD